MAEKKNIVIIGGGIIGSTSAYFLSRHPKFNPATHTITLLEATKIAGGASGKAGGLLALWAYPSAIVPLSYRLHKQLAEEHGGEQRWGYRPVNCGQIEAQGRPFAGPSVSGAKDRATDEKDGGALNGDSVSLQKRSKDAIALLKRAGVPEDLDWLDAESTLTYEEMSDTSKSAQVHPYLFTTSMAELAEEKGVKVVYGSATTVNTDANGRVESISYVSKEKEEEAQKAMPATDVVLAAGPWTQQIWPSAPISALRAHSITIRPTRPVSPYCLFTSISLPKASKGGRRSASEVTPEIYARPNNEVYACGEGDHLIPLPANTGLVEVDPQRCQDIADYVGSISDELRDGEVTAQQACYLPNVSSGGGPLIGKTSTPGLFIAAGHTCWGIQNGPGTGKLISEIVFDGEAKSARISGGSLDPVRYGL